VSNHRLLTLPWRPESERSGNAIIPALIIGTYSALEIWIELPARGVGNFEGKLQGGNASHSARLGTRHAVPRASEVPHRSG
jgi:hypothetical protein